MSGIHHIHKRKRVYKKLQKYPHENKRVRFLDNLLIVVAMIGPFVTLPQILTIYIGRNADGVSSLSWIMYAVINVPWFVYGIVHKEKPIIITYILNFIMNIIVIVGTLMY